MLNSLKWILKTTWKWGPRIARYFKHLSIIKRFWSLCRSLLFIRNSLLKDSSIFDMREEGVGTFWGFLLYLDILWCSLKNIIGWWIQVRSNDYLMVQPDDLHLFPLSGRNAISCSYDYDIGFTFSHLFRSSPFLLSFLFPEDILHSDRKWTEAIVL